MLLKIKIKFFFASLLLIGILYLIEYAGNKCNMLKIKISEKNNNNSKQIERAMNSKQENVNEKFFHQIENDIYLIDYSGTISFTDGLSNMDYIEKQIRKLSSTSGCIKIIFDVRNTIWESPQVHDTLSKTARKIFNPENLNFTVYAAILNNDITGSVSDSEHWFVQKEEAVKWLIWK